MSKRKRKPLPPPKFPIGAQVRVKGGVIDPEYPDTPLGGGSGLLPRLRKAATWSDGTRPPWRLRIPFIVNAANGMARTTAACGSRETGPGHNTVSAITVLGLIDPGKYPDEDYGLFCRARQSKRTIELPLADLEVEESDTRLQVFDDYAYWFENWR